jgi:saccharopine dehydrogenase (NAD+, L-lysine-forming)
VQVRNRRDKALPCLYNIHLLTNYRITDTEYQLPNAEYRIPNTDYRILIHMNIGILRETKTPADSRVPFSPAQCRQVEDEYPGIRIFVQPSPTRCFADNEYLAEGIELTENLNHCDVLLGVKEVKTRYLLPNKTYFIFSHTIKKQSYNKELLQSILEKKIHLVDYEMLTDGRGVRIIGFGRWAGLAGTYIGMRAWYLRQGNNSLVAAQDCNGLEDMMHRASANNPGNIRIALTGDGRVAGGAEEMLNAFAVRKVTLEEYLTRENFDGPVYTQLDPSKYNAPKSGGEFNLQHFFSFPGEYSSNFARFCPKTDMLIMAAYWDPHAPVLFSSQDMRKPDFSIRVIADITCDIMGSVPSSLRTTSFAEPYFDYNRNLEKEENPFSDPAHVTMMTIDNLPCGLPKEASIDFGHHIVKNIIPLLLGEDSENIIERATIAKEGALTGRFAYLQEWVNS